MLGRELIQGQEILSRGFTKEITNAIQTYDTDRLVDVLIALEGQLVEKTIEPGIIKSQCNEIEDFVEQVKRTSMSMGHLHLHLSDAYSSRFAIVVIEGEIIMFITDNSSYAVKKKWEQIK